MTVSSDAKVYTIRVPREMDVRLKKVLNGRKVNPTVLGLIEELIWIGEVEARHEADSKAQKSPAIQKEDGANR